MSHYYIDDNFSKAQDINGNFDWFIIDYLYELIDNDKD